MFEPDYPLIPLEELDRQIKKERRLPGVPSANDLQTNGAKLAELLTLQMQKIEELTLYVIDLNEQVAVLKEENAQLQKEMKRK